MIWCEHGIVTVTSRKASRYPRRRLHRPGFRTPRDCKVSRVLSSQPIGGLHGGSDWFIASFLTRYHARSPFLSCPTPIISINNSWANRLPGRLPNVAIRNWWIETLTACPRRSRRCWGIHVTSNGHVRSNTGFSARSAWSPQDGSSSRRPRCNVGC